MSSDDSDAVLLPPSSDSQYVNEPPSDLNSRPPPLSRTSTYGKKCWICMSDASEDDPNNPPVWRSPCKCSLTAHEACLLDWVADLENPKNSKRKNSTTIQCPQCKSEIKISRPKSIVVDGYRSLERALGRMVLPGLGLGVFSATFAAFWVHGFNSVYLVFGREDAAAIFRRAAHHPAWLCQYWIIPLNLIFARTHYADFVLPSGTLFLLSTQMTDGFEIDMTVWPPLPSTVFACLPAVRSVYNWCYQKAFSNLNKKWLEEVQPRHGQPADGQDEEDAGDEVPVNEEGEEQVVLEFEVNFNGQGEGQDDAPQQANVGQQPQQQNGHVHHILGERGGELIDGSSSIATTVLGALVFPAVSAGMGSLLGFFLPSSWLGPSNTMNGRPGLLRTKWGRSVVGGCLFVVLKDALVLYCRWKLAQGHRLRRIMNFDKKTKKYSV
ncbi:hypothetical protein PV11_07272 [Exophiala sideris]|uniref:RING-CH-type domain-containing protein n=1 Tax=Exophiala sideris TaxID=1016849 RepID=A0A0D1WX27_9EURO|nr:hypothetical protein PV11_07272 [Exophiala sideris]